MILSHRHRFIFIKTSKTAGTSLEIALSRFCGPDDIITPIADEDEMIRKELNYPGPKNFFAPLSEYTVKDVLKFLLKKSDNYRRKKRWYNHISAEEIKDKVESEVWENYYKFCVARNPWDRAVSLYYWRCRNLRDKPTLEKYIDSFKYERSVLENYRKYTINGEVAVDKICRFENLQEDLEEVCKNIGITEQLELPYAKSGFRKDKRNYREILGEEQRDRIAELCRAEIELLGYEY